MINSNSDAIRRLSRRSISLSPLPVLSRRRSSLGGDFEYSIVSDGAENAPLAKKYASVT